MDIISKKVLKIILFLGTLGYFLYWNSHNYGALTIDGVFSSVLMSSAVYIFASLFGILHILISSYLIDLILTVVLAAAFFIKVDKVIDSSHWLTNENSAYVFAAIVVALVILDIRTIVKAIKPSPVIAKDAPQVSNNQGTSDAESILAMSDYLERRLGRKPTYEEVHDVINNLKEAEKIQLN